jgi:hypothetical protein
MPPALTFARQAMDTLQGAFRRRLGEVLLWFHRIEGATLPRGVAGSFIRPSDAWLC